MEDWTCDRKTSATLENNIEKILLLLWENLVNFFCTPVDQELEKRFYVDLTLLGKRGPIFVQSHDSSKSTGVPLLCSLRVLSDCVYNVFKGTVFSTGTLRRLFCSLSIIKHFIFLQKIKNETKILTNIAETQKSLSQKSQKSSVLPVLTPLLTHSPLDYSATVCSEDQNPKLDLSTFFLANRLLPHRHCVSPIRSVE